eukprot:scaffold53280_cov48-Phaeocystis_antarctica.AAC.4
MSRTRRPCCCCCASLAPGADLLRGGRLAIGEPQPGDFGEEDLAVRSETRRESPGTTTSRGES